MRALVLFLALVFCSCEKSQDFHAIDGPTLFAIPTVAPTAVTPAAGVQYNDLLFSMDGKKFYGCDCRR